jgi:hypothetical protein
MNGLREWENDSSGCEDTLGRGQIVEFDTHSEDAHIGKSIGQNNREQLQCCKFLLLARICNLH